MYTHTHTHTHTHTQTNTHTHTHNFIFLLPLIYLFFFSHSTSLSSTLSPTPRQVLRLMCMQSVANNGLKPRLLEYYRRAIMNSYGHEHLITLQRLENAGLLRVQEGKSFSILRKNLKLVADRVDEVVRTTLFYDVQYNYMYVCIHVHVCMYVCMYVFMYMYVYVCMYIKLLCMQVLQIFIQDFG